MTRIRGGSAIAAREDEGSSADVATGSADDALAAVLCVRERSPPPGAPPPPLLGVPLPLTSAAGGLDAAWLVVDAAAEGVGQQYQHTPHAGVPS